MTADRVTSTAELVSGSALDGSPLTDLQLIDRVRAAGSTTIIRGPADRLRRSQWAQELIALAGSYGSRLSIRDNGRLVLVLDVDWDGWAPPDEDVRARHPSRGGGPRP